MKKFKYLKIGKYKKLRYLHISGKNKFYVVFLHGFMSDVEGDKPKAFSNFCKKNKTGFLAVEYSGHGKSSGEFTSGNISKWTNETKQVIKKLVKKKKFILIGSSMGSWISINQFEFFPKQIKGFIGIGSAPEFLERVMWKKFSKKMKRDKILNKSINLKIPVTLFHGKKDNTVPVIYSRKLLKVFKSSKKKLVVIKNGDHSLFKRQFKLKILKELKIFLNFYKP